MEQSTGLVLFVCLAAPSLLSAAPATDGGSSPLISKYCVGCHNEKVKTAGIALEIAAAAPVAGDAGVWEKVLRKIRTGEMPPRGLPRPAEDESRAFTRALESELDKAAAAHPNPGRPAIHRLNRAEYNNAVRDLLGLDLNLAADFPPDDAGYGFDNIADVLSVSPMLTEKYLAAAGKISRLAVGAVKISPSIDQVDVDRRIKQTERVSDDLPFGSRGGTVVERYFPVDAEYAIRVRIRGAATGTAKLDIRVDGRR